MFDTLETGRTALTEVEAKKAIGEAGIPVVETRLARTKKEAIAIAREMGFPVALKIVSPDVIHKTDSGGVKLGISSAAEAGRAYRAIVNSITQNYPQADIHGISVQKMMPRGTEVIMGMFKDAQFGPALMFGLGGIFVEVLKDVSFRIVPITPKDAEEMIKEIRGYPVLQGYRGQEPVSTSTLIDMLLKLSCLVESSPNIRELDLNPVFAYPDGAVTVDARIMLERRGNGKDTTSTGWEKETAEL